METFSALLAICVGNSPVIGYSSMLFMTNRTIYEQKKNSDSWQAIGRYFYQKNFKQQDLLQIVVFDFWYLIAMTI